MLLLFLKVDLHEITIIQQFLTCKNISFISFKFLNLIVCLIALIYFASLLYTSCNKSHVYLVVFTQ